MVPWTYLREALQVVRRSSGEGSPPHSAKARRLQAASLIRRLPRLGNCGKRPGLRRVREILAGIVILASLVIFVNEVYVDGHLAATSPTVPVARTGQVCSDIIHGGAVVYLTKREYWIMEHSNDVGIYCVLIAAVLLPKKRSKH